MACYRLAELISIDDGPLDIFSNLRSISGVHASESKTIWIKSFAKLLVCPFCTGIWFAAILSILVFIPTSVGDIILGFLAIAGIQCYLESRSGNGRDG